MNLDWHKIEEKWRKRWESSRLFESDPDPSRPKFFITVAYPYPNSPQHLGHGRTYTLADVHARYRRMKGYNVLLPMAFHYTGTPILAMAKRIAALDGDLVDTFTNIYKVPKDHLASLNEPISIARYFHEEIKSGMKEMGYSIDWRREFTTIDPVYSSFIEWQFKKLYDKGLITQGSHPVGWCPNDGNPVGQHDTVGDIEPEIGDYTSIKFPSDSGYLPTATLRPETIFGVTNIWLNPDAEYAKVMVGGEEWIVSVECIKKMGYLGVKPVEKTRFKGSALIGLAATNPVTGSVLPILPASFVDPKNATGVVMSVPAHAPYDQQALLDLGADFETLRRFNLDAELVRKIEPITMINSEGYGDNPALQIIRRMGIRTQDDSRLEEATSELYSHEFHLGRLLESCDKYSGLTVADARDRVRQDLLADGKAFTLHEITNRPVICRCGAECVVKIFENQWFINYGDPSWKILAEDCIRQMSLLPEDIRPEFEYTIGWLRQKACARRSGLGTPLPWDQSWIIESLSDSVIYMAYYVIAKHIRQHSLDRSQMNEAVFDYVFLGKGDPRNIVQTINLPLSLLEEMRSEFAYFYPLDSRHSGRDLVPNHLTFFIFNHAAVFPHEIWPRQIVVNGSVLMEGKKMSKSFGNIIPLRDAVKTYAADPLRLTIMATAELLQDADVSLDMVKTFRERLERFHSLTSQIVEQGSEQEEAANPVDRWFLSRLQSHIASVTGAMEKLRVREAIHHCIYLFDQDVQWYLRRTSYDTSQEGRKHVNGVLRRALEARVRLLAPFAPHLCEELWSLLGNDGFASKASWPQLDALKIDAAAEESEELIRSLVDDTNNIAKVTKAKPKRVIFYTSAKWKWHVYLEALRLSETGPAKTGVLMRSLMQRSELKVMGQKVSSFVNKVAEELTSMPPGERKKRLEIAIVDDYAIVKDAAVFFERELESAIEVYQEDDESRRDPLNRASGARPYRPAIYIE